MNIVHNLEIAMNIEEDPIGQGRFTQEKLDVTVAMGEQLLEMESKSQHVKQNVEENEESIDLIIEHDRVIAWRDWRMSNYDQLAARYTEMKEDEEFSLK